MKSLGPLALTALASTMGGAILAWFGVPAGWLAGAMVAVAIAAFIGLPVAVPALLRDTAYVLLGASMGAGVTPDAIERVRTWPLSLVLLTASVVAIFAVSSAYLRRVHGWDPVTARFASVPGAFSAVLIHAAASTADLPRVALAQAIRVFTLIAIMPWLLGRSGAQPSPLDPGSSVTSNAPDLILTLAVSALAGWGLSWLRVPAGTIVGAMVASALLHGAGIVEGQPPAALTAIGFIATGAVVGLRFRGTSLALLRRTLPGALGVVVLALAVSATFALLGERLLGLPFGQLWLAYAPGGAEAMAIMALALQIDPAFVGAHHVARILGLNVAGPIIGRPPRSRPGSLA